MSRIFWACQSVYIDGSYVKGVQSVGLDVANEWETLAPDKGVQDFFLQERHKVGNPKPEITCTIERHVRVDTLPLIFNCTDGHVLSKTGGGLGYAGWDDGFREYTIDIAYGSDDYTYGSSTQVRTLKYCLIQDISYSFSVDGFFTETITFVTNYMENGSGKAGTQDYSDPDDPDSLQTEDYGDDLVGRRFNFLTDESSLGYGFLTDGAIQSVSASISFSYEEIAEKGLIKGAATPSQQNYWKYHTLPVSITGEVTSIVTSNYATKLKIQTATTNLPATALRFKLQRYGGGSSSILDIDFGSKNNCTGISTSGGTAGSNDNVEVTASFQNVENYFKLTKS